MHALMPIDCFVADQQGPCLHANHSLLEDIVSANGLSLVLKEAETEVCERKWIFEIGESWKALLCCMITQKH